MLPKKFALSSANKNDIFRNYTIQSPKLERTKSNLHYNKKAEPYDLYEAIKP